MKAKFVIFDENKDSQMELLNAIIRAKHTDFELVGMFSESNEALDFIMTHEVDVLFAKKDPDTGISQAEPLVYHLQLLGNNVVSIIYSENEQDAFSALECGAFSYFKLPIQTVPFMRMLEKVLHQVSLLRLRNQQKNASVMIRTKTGHEIVCLSEVLFVERQGKKIRMVCEDGHEIYLKGYSLDKLEELLGSYHFYRCYQGFIVNIDKISFVQVNSNYKTYSLKLNNYEGEIILSRDRHQGLMQLLQERCIQINL